MLSSSTSTRPTRLPRGVWRSVRRTCAGRPARRRMTTGRCATARYYIRASLDNRRRGLPAGGQKDRPGWLVGFFPSDLWNSCLRGGGGHRAAPLVRWMKCGGDGGPYFHLSGVRYSAVPVLAVRRCGIHEILWAEGNRNFAEEIHL